MAVKFNKNSANKDYNDLLKELGVINNNNDEKKNVKWIFKTKMMNQCMESLQASEKKARALAEENTRLKQERDSIYTNMRKYENMLHGFEKPRQFEAYTQETHKQTVQENHEMVERLKKLSRSEREARDEIDAMRCRIQAYKKKESIARINGSASPVTNAASIPRKKSRVEDV
jgi:ribosomal protein L15E